MTSVTVFVYVIVRKPYIIFGVFRELTIFFYPGCILLLGRTNMFRYNDPAEAAKLRQEGASVMNLSRLSLLSWSTTDLAASTENLNSTLSYVLYD